VARCAGVGGSSRSELIRSGRLQLGGGINEDNAQAWLDAGAEKVRER
jgi:phosphoribosylformimino-5-aminoimidazole carboxamide ribonucleotide (ProFAR) isomerase